MQGHTEVFTDSKRYWVRFLSSMDSADYNVYSFETKKDEKIRVNQDGTICVYPWNTRESANAVLSALLQEYTEYTAWAMTRGFNPNDVPMKPYHVENIEVGQI